MKQIFIGLFLLILPSILWSQNSDDDAILATILKQYYKNEKVVVKGRGSQFLFLFCDKSNNNEEIYETINSLKISSESKQNLQQQIADKSSQNWNSSLEKFTANHSPFWKSKINDCLSLEEFQKKQAIQNLNNQRLLIVYKPLFIKENNHALVKIVFYRTIEHNSGVVLYMEKTTSGWKIIEQLNPWTT